MLPTKIIVFYSFTLSRWSLLLAASHENKREQRCCTSHEEETEDRCNFVHRSQGRCLEARAGHVGDSKVQAEPDRKDQAMFSPNWSLSKKKQKIVQSSKKGNSNKMHSCYEQSNLAFTMHRQQVTLSAAMVSSFGQQRGWRSGLVNKLDLQPLEKRTDHEVVGRLDPTSSCSGPPWLGMRR